jgi:hypothetical protein
MKRKVSLLITAFVSALALPALLSTCQADLSNYTVRDSEFVHPGVLHTQDEFEALWRLIARWEGDDDDPDYVPYVPPGPADPEPLLPNVNIYDNAEPLAFEKSVEYRDAKRANRKMYGEYRAYKSWQWLKGSAESSATYAMKGPYEYIARDGTYSGTKTNVEADMTAAYQNALMWVLTGDRTHAAKSFQILDAYAHKLKGILGGDYRLMAGLQGMPLAAAAELLRYAKDVNGSTSGYIEEQFAPLDRMMRNVWKVSLDRFLNYPTFTEGNVGLCIVNAYMAMGIYLNDREMYQKAIDQTLYGADNGTLLHYINRQSGQTQESDRDQGHALLGFELMGFQCEVAWKQGDDLYAAFDSALYRASEFITRYNSGDNNIEYTYPLTFASDNPVYWFNPKWIDAASLYPGNPYVGTPENGFWSSRAHEPGTDGRTAQRDVWDLIYNHYVNREGKYMPWTESYLYRDGEQRPADYVPLAGSFLFSGVEVARGLGLYETEYAYH